MRDSKTAVGFAALLSIRRTIRNLIDSPKISLSSPRRNICPLLKELKSLLKYIDFYGRNKRVIPSLGELEETAHEFEDAVDSLVSKRLLSQSESLGNDCRDASTTFTIDLWELQPEIDSFTRTVEGIRRRFGNDDDDDDDDDDEDEDEDDDAAISSNTRSCIDHSVNPWLPEDEGDGGGGDDNDDAAISSNTRSCIDHSVSPWLPEDEGGDDANSSSSHHPPIGLDDLYRKLFNLLTRTTNEKFTYICGMAGIGKSTLAKRAYEDSRVLDHFECHAWVSFHPEYQIADVCLSLLRQLDPNNSFLQSVTNPPELQIICGYVRDIIKSKKCLIVVDDHFELRSKLDDFFNCFPKHYDDFKGQVLIISRSQHTKNFKNVIQMNFLNNEQSWHLIRERVFHNKSCSYGLEEAGKKIAELCGGLPLLIILVAKHLRKPENLTPEYWNKVAEDGIAFLIEADKSFSERLLLSYEVLPPELKVCFLYLGVFPQDYEIYASKIFLLWMGEGLLPLDYETSKKYCKKLLKMLWRESLSLIHRRGLNGKIKTCVLHQAYHPLCVMQARAEKFHHVITGKASISIERMENQRRLCIYNNALFGIKDVHNAMASVSTIMRSLLCTGQHHPYPVPMFLSFDLVKVLDAFTIRFYEFPIEMLKLVLLTYLAFTYNRQLPPFISKLLSVQYLIVRGDVSIISYGEPSYLPKEIWYMKSLIHLQVPGSALPNPPCGESLPNLVTLLDVSARSCNKEVLDGVPNLKKLGIQIVDPLCCFDHLTVLDELESLKCATFNPNPIYRVVAPPQLVSNLSKSITKLSLSGFGYPWDYMKKLGDLPNLEVLKLREYAFRGQKWDVGYWEFYNLKFLIMEDTDLEQLRISEWGLKSLERLIISHCYKLRDIDFEDVNRLKKIELVDCGSETKKIQKKLEEKGYCSLLYVHSSAEKTQ